MGKNILKCNTFQTVSSKPEFKRQSPQQIWAKGYDPDAWNIVLESQFLEVCLKSIFYPVIFPCKHSKITCPAASFFEVNF